MSERYFHFSLGPVQDFIAQARRTRDFWAGSFLLSWLCAIAIKAVEKQGHEIYFPKPDPAFMHALENGGDGPRQGTIPNRFMAVVGEEFNAQAVIDDVMAAWRGLANKVYQRDLQGLAATRTEAIWKQQIENFWDINWALTDEPTDTSILDRLKSWRSYLPPDQPGVKCMMMDGWQELSGEKAPSQVIRDFWQSVLSNGQRSIKTDLREGEYLCAIGFVKRRFVRVFHELTLQMPSNWILQGWRLPAAVPSVAYLAAAPWLAQLLETLADEHKVKLWAFHDKAHELTGSHEEWNSNIKCVREADGHRKWKALNGSVFFDNALDNPRLWDNPALAQTVKEKLKDLRKAASDCEPPSPFYAVLRMDGDELGMQMKDPNKQPHIAGGLEKFTKHVLNIVDENNGFLIYAGGDDALALLPLEYAINCAAALRAHYCACFRDTPISTTISAAIVYAHVKVPLGKVLHESHTLLKGVAKARHGRDAIACRVWKPGGLHLEWAQPWKIAVDDNGRVVAQALADLFYEQNTETPFSSKFFFRIRERFDLLKPADGQDSIINSEQAQSLLAAEYLNSGVNRGRQPKLTIQEAHDKIATLLGQCHPVIRDKNKPCTDWKKQEIPEIGGAMLVRFLAAKGVER